MRLLPRPPQFYCSENPETAGKTSTAITEMKNMTLLGLMNEAGVANAEFVIPYKRIVHLIFVSNNLIEGEQWADRLVKRDIQNMRIFSSKSEVNNASALYQLITEGQYDMETDSYTPVDYVLMCTHPTRLADYCDLKQTTSGPFPSILKRMKDHHPEVKFVVWADEIDKNVKLWKDYVPKFRELGNVIQMNGITATPYNKYWDLMHELGIHNVTIIGTLPDASEYRTISDHIKTYTDKISIKSPVKNFEYLLTHPGEVCYVEIDPVTKREITKHNIPDLKTNTGKIYYVPGEVTTRTHEAISKLANEAGKNALILNGKHKAFRYADGRPPVSIKDYQKRNGTMMYNDIPYSKLAFMDMAICMYNDPSLDLIGTDLIITGFNCITRGITFNRPNFQFSGVILAEYHYREGTKQVEEIIQAVGRAHGNKLWVKEGMVFLSPKYILDMVNEKITQQIEFLRTAPSKITYADVFRDPKGVPIKVLFHNTQIMNAVRYIKRLTSMTRVELMNILKKGVKDGSITLEDPNSDIPSRVKFNFDDYTLNSKRMLDDPAKQTNYRFREFVEHFTKRMSYGQAVKQEGHFDLDITFIEQSFTATQRIEPGTGFISFMFKRPAVAV